VPVLTLLIRQKGKLLQALQERVVLQVVKTVNYVEELLLLHQGELEKQMRIMMAMLMNATLTHRYNILIASMLILHHS